MSIEDDLEVIERLDSGCTNAQLARRIQNRLVNNYWHTNQKSILSKFSQVLPQTKSNQTWHVKQCLRPVANKWKKHFLHSFYKNMSRVDCGRPNIDREGEIFSPGNKRQCWWFIYWITGYIVLKPIRASDSWMLLVNVYQQTCHRLTHLEIKLCHSSCPDTIKTYHFTKSTMQMRLVLLEMFARQSFVSPIWKISHWP